VRAVNSSTATNAVGAVGVASATGNAVRTGVAGGATGANGVGVKGSGVKYGVFSNGPLGISSGKTLVCTACVTANDLRNRKVMSFNLAAGTNSAPVTLPQNTPVQVLGVTLTFDFRGVASATMLRIPNQFLEWTGLESTAGSAITQGFSAVPGTHILFLDFAHQVDIEVNDANSIRVHNGSGAQRAGNIVITW
jgi:hypothetical protein